MIDWYEDPVKLEFTNKPALISSIPFPTVTICPTVIADSNKVNASDPHDVILRAEETSEEKEYENEYN